MTHPGWLRKIIGFFNPGGTSPVNWAERPAEEAWQAAVDGEVSFWANWLATKGGNYPAFYAERLDPDLPLQSNVAELIEVPAGATVRLLDVGAGPLTFLGRKNPTWHLEITAVDALAEQYSALLDDAGVIPPVRTQSCESERLTEVFAPNSFDVVFARNTLDHSYDPVGAITQMVACAKPGAVVFIMHHRNTAEDENYHGMHQWNFEANDGTLTVWRPGRRADIGEVLADHGTVERTWFEETFEYVVIRKAALPTTG